LTKDTITKNRLC